MSDLTAPDSPNDCANGTLRGVPHPRYCDRRAIFLLIGGTIYSIPLRLASKHLVDMTEDAGAGESLEGPLPLENISTHETESLLNVINASWVGGKPELTDKDWAAALYAATELDFTLYRQHIINVMADQVRGMEAFEVLDLASRCQVEEWRSWVFQELCVRPKPLTADQGRKLGFQTLVTICSIRENFARSRWNQCEKYWTDSRELGCTCVACSRILGLVKAEKALNLDF